MVEVFCSIFLVSFLICYAALILVLVGAWVRGGLQSRLKTARVFEAAKHLRELVLSLHTQRN